MEKKIVQKVSEKLAELADSAVSQSACYAFWGEIELPECMRPQVKEEFFKKDEE